MSIKLVDGGQDQQWLKPTSNWPASRSKLKWPFDAESHMNKPIGEDAVYIDAKFYLDGNNDPHNLHLFTPNHEHIVNPTLSDAQVPFYGCAGTGSCFPPVGRCSGTFLVQDQGLPAGPCHYPFDYIVPETGTTVGDFTNTDSPSSWTLPDLNSDYFYSTGGFARCIAGGPIYGGAFSRQTPIKGMADEDFNGKYGGSGIQMRGGSIKLEDITRTDDWIPHVGMIWMRPYSYYMNRSTLNAESRWPARYSDASWSKYPSGPGESIYWEPYNLPSSFIPAIKMGCLLAIPKTETANSVGIQTELGLKIFNMLQDYGAYTCNESGFNSSFNRMALSTQKEAAQEVIDKYGHQMGYDSIRATNPLYPPAGSDWRRWMEDMMAMHQKLHVVDDNSQTNIGGAGTLRFRPPAPPFSD